jgi:hypothetical protein
MKRRKKSTQLTVIETEVIEAEEMPFIEPIQPIPTIYLQRVPNLTNAIAFALLAIRTAKRNGTKLNVEINLTNVYCFDVPTQPEKPKELNKVTNILKSLL